MLRAKSILAENAKLKANHKRDVKLSYGIGLLTGVVLTLICKALMEQGSLDKVKDKAIYLKEKFKSKEEEVFEGIEEFVEDFGDDE